jgi:hypothetical protein
MGNNTRKEQEQFGDINKVAKKLKEEKKNVQLIYGFNGTGKTLLSREFVEIINDENKVIYYNSFTEDLFYWNNENHDIQLKIHHNKFIKWILEELGQDKKVIEHFQRYTDPKLEPKFEDKYTYVTFEKIEAEVDGGNSIKISKGEESYFIWSIFYTLLEQIFEIMDDDKFKGLEYIFIDDPVSSLDENHLIRLAVDLAQLIKKNDEKSLIKFIITTHNPLFFNVLHNEFTKGPEKIKKFQAYVFEKSNSPEKGYHYKLKPQNDDSPFAYHIHLINELNKADEEDRLHKYHFNFVRNILEKTATFLGYKKWGDLLEKDKDSTSHYENRITNLYSHSKHATDETKDLTHEDKIILKYLIERINNKYFPNVKQSQQKNKEPNQ